MKFSCVKSKLQEAVNIVQKAISSKSTMPILQGILIEAKEDKIILIGSDIDLSIETTISTNVEEEGKIVVNSRLFGEIIKRLPGEEVEINTMDNNFINISCNKYNASLVCMNAEAYPKLQKIDTENIMGKAAISKKLLKNMIRSTIFAIAQDETRPIFTGVLFEINDNKLNLVALDGYRLALRSKRIESDSSINAVIPGKTLNEVSKILQDDDKNVSITFTKNQVLFDFDNTRIFSTLLQGEFIKYNSIIPEEFNLKVTVKRDEILNSIERASLIGKEGDTNLVKFNIKDDTLLITSNSQMGNVKEELSIILQGQPLVIAFNSKYLIDIFKIMEDEEITMELSTSVSPCVIRNKNNDDCTYLILPVRLLNN